jgi:hypothetical protein
MLGRPSRTDSEGWAVDERAAGVMRHAQPIRQAGLEAGTRERASGPLEDSRALTILTTEHWSLLSARALVYNEAFTRVSMFLTFLSATLVALGLLSTATGFNREFLLVAAVTFAVDLFLGLVTLGRVNDASWEDLRYLAGMNRLRHAYHDMVPGLERYFMSGKYDDQAGLLAFYSPDQTVIRPTAIESLRHGLTTISGLMIVLCSMVVGVLLAVLLLLISDAPALSGFAAIGAFAASLVFMTIREVKTVSRFMGSLRPEFPTPPVDLDKR